MNKSLEENPVNNVAVPSSLKAELAALLNRHSREILSDTPDFILAQFLINVLKSYEAAIKNRDAWFKFNPWCDRDKPHESPVEIEEG